jgi:hypothetical protein
MFIKSTIGSFDNIASYCESIHNDETIVNSYDLDDKELDLLAVISNRARAIQAQRDLFDDDRLAELLKQVS